MIKVSAVFAPMGEGQMQCFSVTWPVISDNLSDASNVIGGHMKKAYPVLLIIIVFLSPVIPSSTEAAHSYSLKCQLDIWDASVGDIRPGGWVEIGQNALFDSDETTIEAWFKPASYATGVGEDEYRVIIWNGDGTGGHDPYWVFIDRDGYLVARVTYSEPYQLKEIKSATPVSLHVWHHFALVISLTETSLSLDGVKQPAVVQGAGSACKGTNYLAFGRSLWHWNPYDGLLDEIRIWSTARTEVEILNNMPAGRIFGNEISLIGYWDFEPTSDPSVLEDLTDNKLNGNIYGRYWSWFQENAPVVSSISINIDIKPGSYPNSINLKSKGVVPVAILSSTDFDANTVDPSTVKFAAASPRKWKMEDVDGNGMLDMLLHFETRDLSLTKDCTEAILTGKTTGGQDLEGKDSVNIVPKAKGKK